MFRNRLGRRSPTTTGGDDDDDHTKLISAVQNNKIDEVKQLLDTGIDQNLPDRFGRVAIYVSVAYKYKDITKLLVERRADVTKDRPPPSRDGSTQYHTPLMHSIVQACSIDEVDMFLKNGANIESKNDDGITPLMIAVRTSNINVCRLLIENGADVKAKDHDHRKTVLHIVSDPDIAELLMNNHADINAKDANGRSPLDLAVIGSKSQIISLLVKSNATLGAGSRQFTSSNNDGFTERGVPELLNTATECGRCDIIKEVLESSPRVTNPNFIILMKKAVEFNHLDIIELLLKAKANINIAYHGGQTLLQNAVHCSNLDLIQFLIRNGARIDIDYSTDSSKSPMMMAITANNHDIVAILLSNGYMSTLKEITTAISMGNVTMAQIIIETMNNTKTLDTPHSQGVTLLQSACARDAKDQVEDQVKLIELLLDGKANPNIIDSNGNTPLHLALSSCQSPMVVQLLIDHGAQINRRNKVDDLPLQMALKCGYVHIARMLMAKGGIVAHSNPSVPLTLQYGAQCPDTGDTFLHCAVLHSRIDIIRAILCVDAMMIHTPNHHGKTPLHQAKTSAIVELLLDHGADINAQDAQQRTALFYAPNVAVAECLIRHGIDVSIVDIDGKTADGFHTIHHVKQCITNAIVDTSDVLAMKHQLDESHHQNALLQEHIAQLQTDMNRLTHLYEEISDYNIRLGLEIKSLQHQNVNNQ